MLAVVVVCEKKDVEGEKSLWERSNGLEIVRHDEGMYVAVCECACKNAAMGPSTVSVRMWQGDGVCGCGRFCRDTAVLQVERRWACVLSRQS